MKMAQSIFLCIWKMYVNARIINPNSLPPSHPTPLLPSLFSLPFRQSRIWWQARSCLLFSTVSLFNSGINTPAYDVECRPYTVSPAVNRQAKKLFSFTYITLQSLGPFHLLVSQGSNCIPNWFPALVVCTLRFETSYGGLSQIN